MGYAFSIFCGVILSVFYLALTFSIFCESVELCFQWSMWSYTSVVSVELYFSCLCGVICCVFCGVIYSGDTVSPTYRKRRTSSRAPVASDLEFKFQFYRVDILYLSRHS